MTNISALGNITQLDLNFSIINVTEEIIPNIISNANTGSDNWFGLIVMITMFTFLLWELTKENGKFRLDFVKGLVASSGITTLIGIIMIVTNISSTFSHLMWFGTILTVSLIFSWILKQKGG